MVRRVQSLRQDRPGRNMPPLPTWPAASILAAMRPLVPLILLTACGASVASDGRWLGTMTPDPAAPGCEPGRASLVATRGAVLFTPNEGTLTLQGAAAPDGPVTAIRTTTGADKKPYVLRLAARLDGDRIAGTYTTPRCSYTVTLRRA